jgi:hypothetical protein
MRILGEEVLKIPNFGRRNLGDTEVNGLSWDV